MEKCAAEIREQGLELMQILLACTPTAGFVDVMKNAFGRYTPQAPSKPPGSLKEENVWVDEEGNEEEPDDSGLPSSAIQEFNPEEEAQSAKGKGGKRIAGSGKVVPSKRIKVEADGGSEKYNILSKEVKVFFPTAKGTHLHLSVDSSLRKRDSAGSDGKTWRYRCLFAEKGEAAGYSVSDQDKECAYTCQQLGAMSNHLRKVHLGHAIGCKFCDWRSYRANTWIDHMKKYHKSKTEEEWFVDANKMQPVQFEITEEVEADEVVREMFKAAEEK